MDDTLLAVEEKLYWPLKLEWSLTLFCIKLHVRIILNMLKSKNSLTCFFLHVKNKQIEE